MPEVERLPTSDLQAAFDCALRDRGEHYLKSVAGCDESFPGTRGSTKMGGAGDGPEIVDAIDVRLVR
jgi:hypothetical protein